MEESICVGREGGVLFLAVGSVDMMLLIVQLLQVLACMEMEIH